MRRPRRRGIIGAVLSRLLLLLLGLGACVACGPPPRDPAVDAYERFAAALREGRSDEVHALLSPASQQTLATRMQLPPGSAGEAVRARLAVRPGWTFEVHRGVRPRLEAGEQAAARRVVRAPLAGREWRVPMVQVEGDWRVDLFGAQPVPPAEG